MKDGSKVWYLRRVDLFSSLADHQVEHIAQLLGDHQIPAGVELLGERRDGDICIVKEGVVRLHGGDARHPVTLALLGPGRVFGPTSRRGGSGASRLATTMVPSYVCFASWAMMTKILFRYPEVMVGLIHSLADEVWHAESWRSRVGMVSPCDRLADLLVELGEEFGQPTDAGQRIPFPLTQAELGQMTGLSRETVSRLMGHFSRQGWVTREEELLVVRDSDALRDCGHAAAVEKS